MSITPEQSRAILVDEGNVLVSASAGSGKTFVMINRVIRLIIEGKATVGDVLAVTFVRLAAQEMKEKLTKALCDEIAKGGENAALLKAQLAEVPTSDFCTLDSFCANFLRKYFFEAGLDPRFRVLEEGEASVLKSQSIDELFEQLFEQNDTSLIHLATVLSRRRRLQSVKDCVLRVYEFLWSEEQPTQTAQGVLEYYTEQKYAEMRASILRDERAAASELAREALELAEQSAAAGIARYAEKAAECAELLNGIAAKQSEQDYLAALNAWSFRRPTVRFKEEQAALGAQLQARFKGITEAVSALKKSAEPLMQPYGEGLESLLQSKTTAQALIDVTLKFERAYAQKKAEAGALDFSDLEHFTLKLLCTPDVQREASSRYKYVFADEYQDINGVQESILQRISGGNLFMVGDVKQSIYAFRGCNPAYFNKKFARFQGGDGTAILLNGNFRCARAVIDTVNRTFTRVMTVETSGLDYARDGAMQGGELYGEHTGRAALHVVEGEKKKEEIAPAVYRVKGAPLVQTKQGGQEEEIVRIVREELGKEWYDIKDKRVKRVRYGDIAVLARTGAGIERVAAALIGAGIPVSAERKQSIVGYPEIRALIDLLRLICCFEQDAPLVSVMLSPVGGFSEEQLASIRLLSPVGPFRDAVRSAAEREDELGGKLRAFFEYMQTVRERADFLGAGELIERVIAERSFDVYYAAAEGGENALRRIRRFVAESRTQTGELSVHEFLDKATNMPSSFVLSEAGGEDCVRVISMHASKGLEFPVVILAGLGGMFNTNDIKEEILLSREHGIAVRRYDLQRRKKADTLFCAFVKRELRRGQSRDEMRLLYVAMTRAKYSLHLVCPSTGEKRGAHAILSASRLSDFLSQTDAPVCCAAAGEGEQSLPREHVLAGEADKALTQQIRSRLQFVYPYLEETRLPAKTTVTRVAADGHTQHYEAVNLSPDGAAEKGTAIHALLEQLARGGMLCDGTPKTAEQIRAFAERLCKDGKMDAQTLELCDFGEAERIVALPVFKRLYGAALYPEQPFIVQLEAGRLYDGGGEQPVLVQGVIDLLAVKDGKAYVLDYKRTSLKNSQDILRRYSKQLTLYQTAVRKALGLSVQKVSIINLLSGEEIEVRQL